MIGHAPHDDELVSFELNGGVRGDIVDVAVQHVACRRSHHMPLLYLDMRCLAGQLYDMHGVLRVQLQ